MTDSCRIGSCYFSSFLRKQESRIRAPDQSLPRTAIRVRNDGVTLANRSKLLATALCTSSLSNQEQSYGIATDLSKLRSVAPPARCELTAGATDPGTGSVPNLVPNDFPCLKAHWHEFLYEVPLLNTPPVAHSRQEVIAWEGCPGLATSARNLLSLPFFPNIAVKADVEDFPSVGCAEHFPRHLSPLLTGKACVQAVFAQEEQPAAGIHRQRG